MVYSARDVEGGQCARCGRKLKHGLEVNGSVYGPVCVHKAFPDLEAATRAPKPAGRKRGKEIVQQGLQPSIFEDEDEIPGEGEGT